MGTNSLSFLSIIVLLVFIPIVLGQIPYCFKKNKRDFVEFWLNGFMLEVALFAVTFLIFSMGKGYNFRRHGVFYVLLLGILLLFVFIYKFFINKNQWKILKIPNVNWKWIDGLIISAILILGILLIINIIYYKNVTSSSTVIEETVNAILQSNTTGTVDPYTGLFYTCQEDALNEQMLLAFWAFLSWASRIHPIILIEYILPIYFIFLFYLFCFRVGKEFFGQDIKKVWWFIMDILLLHNLGNQREWLLFKQLEEPWTGEHILAFLILPAIVLRLMRLGDITKKREYLYELIITAMVGILLCVKGWFYISVIVILAVIVYMGRKVWKC